MTAADAHHMQRALDLAERGRGRVAPNPLVGCVIVAGGAVVGEGWHQRAGEAHAEVNALRAAGDAARGATAYVTLEPCDHHGRTPPCTEALIGAGVGRVVVASLDPNPRVNGAGVARLRAAGIDVDVGLLGDAADEQNEVFRTAQLLGRPFVLYKTAMSLDGKVALSSGPARWITGPEARRRVHRWRNEYAAIAVGSGTVLADDPSLTTRLEPGDGEGRTPVKVIFDGRARTPVNARLFEPDEAGEPARVIVVASAAAPTDDVAALEARGAEVLRLGSGNGRPPIRSALEELLRRGLTSLLLEGGGTLASAFFGAGAVDKVAWFVAPKLLGGADAPGPLAGAGAERIDDAVLIDRMHTETVGDDLLITGRPRHANASTPEGRTH